MIPASAAVSNKSAKKRNGGELSLPFKNSDII